MKYYIKYYNESEQEIIGNSGLPHRILVCEDLLDAIYYVSREMPMYDNTELVGYTSPFVPKMANIYKYDSLFDESTFKLVKTVHV